MDPSLLVALIGAIAVILAALIRLIGEVLKVVGSLISVWITHRMPTQEGEKQNGPLR